MHPVSFFSKNSICNVNTRGFQSPDFGIPPISFFEAEIRFSKRTLNCVCAMCNFLNWFFMQGRKYLLSKLHWRDENSKIWPIYLEITVCWPSFEFCSRWTSEINNGLTDSQTTKYWAGVTHLVFRLKFELSYETTSFELASWVRLGSCKKNPRPQILRQKNYAQKHVFRDIF